MNKYLVLIRGINVGGKNKIPMAALKTCLETLGFSNVTTYIASGNVILSSEKSATATKAIIEEALPKNFTLDSTSLKVLIVTKEQLEAVVKKKPKEFGEHPEKYHSDVIFLIDITADEAMKVFAPREGVDTVWKGERVIYSQRLSAELTKSRLSKIIGTSAYKSMTIRTWNTTTTLLKLLNKAIT